MSIDEENTQSPDVGTTETTELALMIEEQPLAKHVRIDGQAGVRVQHFDGVTQQKRVTGVDSVPVSASADHKLVPLAVLAEVRELLFVDRPLAAADAIRAVRELLEPWL